VGIAYLSMSEDTDHATTSQKYREFLQQVRWANDKGFAGIWIVEHHFSTYSVSSSPLILLARAAAEAPDLRIGTGVLVLPLWDPRRVAADVSTLDVLSGGRVDIGIGRGYQPHEFAGFGQDLAESRARFEESVTLITQLLAETDVRFTGRHYTVDTPVTVLPRPVQRPHPPFWAAAVSPESIRFAVQRGFNFMGLALATPADLAAQWRLIEELSQAAGSPAQGREFSVNRYVYCGHDPGEHRLAAREAARQVQLSKALATGGIPRGGIVPGRRASIDPADEKLAYERLLAGTPEEIIAQVAELATAGVTYISAGFQYGAMPTDPAVRSMRLFADAVLPAMDGIGTRLAVQR
jgi:alkanesulfonate monooxygenase SsuD/methylene tetrahydromethanopterin reductase-like flavin-dependent oxidoreductase (luciferase family)